VAAHVLSGIDEAHALALAAAAERGSEHPLAAAIVAYAEARLAAGRPGPDASAVEARPGRGVKATVEGRAVLAGTESLLAEAGVEVQPLSSAAASWAGDGLTPVFLAIDGRASAAFGIADTLRGEASSVVSDLSSRGIDVVMLTGDRRETAEAVARSAGIDHVIAGVLPEGKVEAIGRLQAGGRRVAMVGDGLNDAPALARADVGIAMASGTDVAAHAADVTLMRSDLRGVSTAIALAKAAMRAMRQNLFWAFIYNVVGIPVAAGVLYPSYGILLSPIIASAAMAFSSVSVVSNSLRLRRASL
jgi:Cu+-exporting ATPase